MARRKRRRSAAGTHRRRRRRRSVALNPRRRRRRRIVRANPVRRHRTRRRHVSHRRRYRRNPGFGGGGLLKGIIRGAGDGLAVTVGSGLTRFVASKIPFGQSTTIGQSAVQLVVATFSAPLVKKAVGERAAAFYLAGAYADVIKKLAMPLPVVGPLLNGVGVYPRATPVGLYPRARLNGLNGRPNAFPAAGGVFGRDTSDDLGVDVDMNVMAGAQPTP